MPGVQHLPHLGDGEECQELDAAGLVGLISGARAVTRMSCRPFCVLEVRSVLVVS